MSGFKISSNFLEAANILNQIAVEKFAKILKRILHRDLAGGKTAPIFDGQESLQATVALGLTVQQLQIAIDCCSYIYEQAAFTGTDPEALYSILLDGGMSDQHAKVTGRLWASEGAYFIAQLKTRPLGYPSLQNVSHSIDIAMCSSDLSRMHELRAMLQLTISTDTNTSSKQHILAEFSHDELFKLLVQLDRAQAQIDAVSSNS